MTEIPEHLLKRAAERRAAMSGGSAPAAAPAAGDAPAAAGDAAAVEPAAPAAKAAPAPLPTLEAEPAKPATVPAVVAAAKRRKRVPFWAAGVLAFLPVWALLYVNAMQPPPAGENDPLAIGAEVWNANGCAGCHGATGGGGVGQQLNQGHVLDTFKDPLDMAHWIHFGADGGARADGTYGDADRPGGPMTLTALPAKMTAFPDIPPEQLAALVIYVREEISGGAPADDPNFNAETFTADPAKLAAAVQAMIDAGPGGDPDKSAAGDVAETEG